MVTQKIIKILSWSLQIIGVDTDIQILSIDCEK